jgi:hypothetical protein
VNREIHLAVALPEHCLVTYEDRQAETGFGLLVSMLSLGAVVPWKAELGKIWGFSVRVASDSHTFVTDVFQDRQMSWRSGDRKESSLVAFGFTDPTTGDEQDLSIFWDGIAVHLAFCPAQYPLLHHDMQENPKPGAQVVRTELDRSNEVDSVEATS